ncbi:MAG: hypothetical protein GY750_06710 [Lentisphaerae bacterium]|nr:hypothetical protein [Lentisphaerota bacterium]MCP4101100.1 hypothetical protein [Lentisphaerota bacterium]
MKYLCDIFKRTYRPYIKKFRRNYGFVLNEMYQVYLANDVIVLGGNHSEKNSRAHACLRDFLKFLHIKKGVMNFRNHAIFYEAELSMYSHYRRRAFSDYSSEDNFRFKYNPDYKNPNTLNQYVDVISKKKLEYEKVNWFNNYGIRMFFYDDRITDSKITPPNLIIGDPLFTREQFEKDLVTIKKMCNINEIPGNIQKRKNGFTTCLELRQRLHYFMAGRIAHEICRTPKSFVPIGSAHVRTSISSDGKTIPPIQYYLKEYLRSYGKKVFTLKFIEKDMPSFDRVRDKYVDATISWPAWIS